MQALEVVNDDSPQDEAATLGHVFGGNQTMSKTQMKKLAKRQKALELRPERRRIEKEKRKEKRRELRKLQQENDEHPEAVASKTKLMSESDNKFRIVIDMDFEEYMTDDEIGKAAKQVNRIYSINRHSERPCQLYLTSLKGRIKDRFAITNAGYNNWDMNISDKDFETTFQAPEDRENLVYLTADTDTTLPSVEDLLKNELRIFVIGGLVDHNRHKSLCYERALKRKITTAKLPIKEHLRLCQRHILSTVTVFEILSSVLAKGVDWREALLACIPKRKIDPKELTIQNLESPNDNKQQDCATCDLDIDLIGPEPT